jgi:hypothetical protein
MTTAALGPAFLESGRRHFATLWRRYRFQEVESRHDLNGAVLVAKNERQYLRLTCDFRDRWLEVAVGKLAEGLVPPPPIAPPREPADVRLIGSAILTWLATGDKERSFATGTYPEETPEALDRAVQGVADQLMSYGARVLDGDEREWQRAAELAATRVWRPG